MQTIFAHFNFWILINAYFSFTEAISHYEIYINANEPFLKNISHFWESTGFCPPDPHEESYKYLLSQDMKLNLAFIGGLPNNAIKQVRVHWLMDSITVNFTKKDQAPEYNFSKLDSFIDILLKNNLAPGFEIMGNPGNIFHDFENETEIFMWRDLVEEMATHFITRYGLEYVKKWNWETWNEPDNKDFDNLNMTLQGYLNYYDACSEGLLHAESSLKLGGPAEKFVVDRSPYAWALLQHCYNGTNYFTGKQGVRLDYISTHMKGGGYSLPILNNETELVKEITSRWPEFSRLPLFNTEGDPLVRWSDAYKWRADNTYAAMIVKILSQHWNEILSHPNSAFSSVYSLLSNDNGFLSYYPDVFEERTLLARFQINNTSPPYVMFFRKPAYIVMGLLSYLGNTPLMTIIRDANGSMITVNTSSVGVMSSIHFPNNSLQTDSWQASFLLYNSNDTQNSTTEATISIIIDNLEPSNNQSDIRFVWLTMDNTVSNPYAIWIHLGKPYFPSFSEIKRISKKEEPQRSGPSRLSKIKKKQMRFEVQLRMPGIKLLHICAKPISSPGKVKNISVYNITFNTILITWNDEYVGTKCLKTYEVHRSVNKDHSFTRINSDDTVFNTYIFKPRKNCQKVLRHSKKTCSSILVWAPQNSSKPRKRGKTTSDHLVRGYYKVRAVDYWNRPGPFSAVHRYG